MAPENDRSAGARIAGAAAVVALFLFAAALCLTRVTDTDLFWHLAGGDWIRRAGEVPRRVLFSYTVPGRPCVEIHWLFQVVLSFIHERGGLPALAVTQTLLILGTLGFLFARARRLAGTNATAAVMLIAILAMQERFLMRPEIVSWIILAVEIALLEGALARHAPAKRRRLILWVVLPALQIIWVNVQSLFLIGPVMIALALVAALAEGWRRDPGTAERAIDVLVGLTIASFAGLVNPYGARALRLPFEQFFVQLGGGSLLSRTIAEFQPPLSGYLVTPSIIAFIALGILWALSIPAAGRVRPFDLLVSGAMFYAALRARRNIPLFVIAAVPVLLRAAATIAGGPRADAWAGRLRQRLGRRVAGPGFREGASAAVSVALAIVSLALTRDVVTNRFFLRAPTERWWGFGMIPGYFPEEGARFIEKNGIPGNVFHPLASGGFLIHAWRGERRVFIDGRNDPYLDGILETYLRAIADPAAFEEAARRYQIAAVLWPHERALEAKPLLAHLARGRGWTLARLDPGSSVWLRADVPMPNLLDQAPFAHGRPRDQIYDELLRGLAGKPFDGPPIREIALGEFFSVTGDPRGAEFFLGRAVERLPRSAPVLHDYAIALERQGRRDEARAAHERALAADPGFAPSLAARGAALLEEGRLEEAERFLDKAWKAGERGSRLLIARARLFDRQGKRREAVEAYREALAASPREADLLREIGSFYLRHDQAGVALDFFTEASAAEPDDPAAARALAGALASLGRMATALEVARDAARSALDRMSGAEGGEEDRQVVLLAARLEVNAGNREKAAAWLEALSRAGRLRDDELRADPALGSLVPPAGTRPRR